MAIQKKKTALDFFKQEAVKTEADIKTEASGKKNDDHQSAEEQLNQVSSSAESNKEDEIIPQEEQTEAKPQKQEEKPIESPSSNTDKYKEIFNSVVVVDTVKQNISKVHNNKLKALSLAEGSTIASILHNIIQEWFDTNQKQVKQSLKKIM